HVVQQAHVVALALQHGEQWDATHSSSAALSGLQGVSSSGATTPGSLSGANLLPPTFLTITPPASSGVSSLPSGSNTLLWPPPPSVPIAARPQSRPQGASEATGTYETVSAPAQRTSRRRRTSQARPVEGQLNDEIRQALSVWATDNAQSPATSP